MKYWYWMGNIPGIGNKKQRYIIDHVGNPERLYHMKAQERKEIPGLTQKNIDSIAYSKKTWNLEKKWEELSQKGINYITIFHKKYPQKLKNIPDSPFGLYVKGKLPPEEQKRVAIVGSRYCSDYGRNMAYEFGKCLGKYGIPVISGMAKGIDGIAQGGAIKGGGETYAVLGCGVDICYPGEHRNLYQEMIRSGGVISEYAPGTMPSPRLFPQRNRLISGLSDMILVVEAKERSGSLITTDFALEQGRDIFAIPGRLTDTKSAGCNNLIRQGAGIVLSQQDLLTELGVKYTENTEKNKKNQIMLEKEEIIVYSCLGLEPKNLDTIKQELSMNVSEVAHILFLLQFKGVVTETSKNCYIRNDTSLGET